MIEPGESKAARRARNLAALLEMGFQCVEEPMTTESVRLDHGTWRVCQALPAMGTVVSVAVLHATQDAAESAIGGALGEMERLVDLLNRHESSSAIGVLNDRGRLPDAPDELLYLLHRARGVALLSSGAFDVTVAPIIDLYRDRRDTGAGPPPEAALADALQRVDATSVNIEGRRVALLRDGMSVTLDGIAKGYIVDRMAAALTEHGAASFLINAGGDIRATGARDGHAPWRVAIQDPEGRGNYPDVLALQTGAVATSGSYEIYFDGDHTCHHVVDSRGVSPTETVGVTVTAPTAMQADALATAVFVCGPDGGMHLIESIPGAECLIVRADGGLLRSPGWQLQAAATQPTRGQ